MALANIKITDEEALQIAANGGPMDLYVKLSCQDPQTLLEANALMQREMARHGWATD